MNKKDLTPEDYKFLNLVELSLHKAFTSEIIPSLRAVFILWEQETSRLKIYFFNDGEITRPIETHYASIMAEVEGDYWDRNIADCGFEAIRCDYPKALPYSNFTIMVYGRKEPFIDPS